MNQEVTRYPQHFQDDRLREQYGDDYNLAEYVPGEPTIGSFGKLVEILRDKVNAFLDALAQIDYIPEDTEYPDGPLYN